MAIEIYVYDYNKVQSEWDNPQDAVLYHYPSHLSERVILTTACHFAALYQSTRAFLQLVAEDDDQKTAHFKLTNGCCSVLALAHGQLLLVIKREKVAIHDIINKIESNISKLFGINDINLRIL